MKRSREAVREGMAQAIAVAYDWTGLLEWVTQSGATPEQGAQLMRGIALIAADAALTALEDEIEVLGVKLPMEI